jgi:hypothetical protein
MRHLNPVLYEGIELIEILSTSEVASSKTKMGGFFKTAPYKLMTI